MALTPTIERPTPAEPQGPENKNEKNTKKPGFVQRLGANVLHVLKKDKDATVEDQKKAGRRTIGGATGVAAAVAVVAAIANGATGAPSPEGQGTTQEQVDPGEDTEQEPVEGGENGGEQSTDTLDTITIEVGQSDEQAALDIQTQLSNWEVAGADKFIEAWTTHAAQTNDASNEAYDAFVKNYVQEQSQPYLSELFGVNSVDELADQSTKDYVTGTMEILEKNLYLVLRTQGKFETETQLNSSSATQNNQGRTFTLNTEVTSNAAQSGAAGVIRENGWVDSTGEKAIVTASTWIDSESERISSISIALPN